jgi:uncharacterized protein (TIGR03083 family)
MTTFVGVVPMAVQRVMEIRHLTHVEAGRLAQIEYERVVVVLESLAGDDWVQPTYCTEWNVRQMVAHLAGSMTGSTSFAEFLHQNITNPNLKKFDNVVDAINKLQVDERAERTPAELVAEFRQNGQIALHNRRSLPWLVRKIHLPMGPLGFASVEYLMDTIYPRDEWMHRYDICAATGKEMVVTPEHDGRITVLVLRDIAKKLKKQLAQRSIALRLLGKAGGDYLFGHSSPANCVLQMDLFDLHLRASGRISAAEAASRAVIDGDQSTAAWFLDAIEVPY